MHAIRRTISAGAGVLAALLMAAVLSAAATAGPATSAVAVNRARAGRLVPRLLAAVRLPPGTTPAAGDPSQARLLASAGSGAPITYARFSSHRYFRVPGRWQALATAFSLRPPRGTRATGDGDEGNSGQGIVSEFDDFTLTHLPPGVALAGVQISFAAARGGGGAVRVDAWAVWLVPRPAWERVPAGAGAVRVTDDAGTGPALPVATVTGRGPIAALTRFVNRLGRAQPGVEACPAIMPPFLDLRFLDGARLLARAVQRGCGTMGFTLGTRTAPALAAPDPQALPTLLWRVGALPACSASGLRATATAPAVQSGALRVLTLDLVNTAATACGLGGSSGVGLIDAAGAPLPTRVAAGPFTAAVLVPGETGRYTLSWSSDCATPVRAAGLRLVLPHGVGQLDVPVPSGAVAFAPCAGRLFVAGPNAPAVTGSLPQTSGPARARLSRRAPAA